MRTMLSAKLKLQLQSIQNMIPLSMRISSADGISVATVDGGITHLEIDIIPMSGSRWNIMVNLAGIISGKMDICCRLVCR